MNISYCILWNDATGTWQVVSELGRTCGRSPAKSVRAAAGVLLASGLVGVGSVLHAAGPLPTQGVVTSGSGSATVVGNTLTIEQQTQRLGMDWQSFSIGQGNTVRFVQPSAAAIAVNRVLGDQASVIAGQMQANGRVVLLNPNGVVFTPTAQVDVGGLVASTLRTNTDQLSSALLTLEGDSRASILQQGRITTRAVRPGR